jgi:hypothetical protein
MELFTLDRNFQKQHIIDNFSSIIWTERYYGNSEVELVTSLTSEMLSKLPVGTFLGIAESDEVMILETADMGDVGKLKLKGISLLPWLDNRFVRASAAHEDRYLYLSGPPGQLLWDLVYYFTNANSPYLNGTIDIGIANPSQFVIPGLGLQDYDDSGNSVTIGVPYGPLYKALSDIATTYEIGMRITLDAVTDTSYFLGFRSYKGLDRTSDQTQNSVTRFSPDMESFTNIKEIQSISQLKTEAFTFAPSNPGGMATTPGSAALSGDQYTGFDLRAIMVFAEDITTDQVGSDPAVLLDILNSRSQDALTSNRFVKAVDGEIVTESQLKYGIHYNLGDIIEVQGNSGTINAARVTEYIRSQDSTGEKAYPTVSVIE